MARAFKTSTSPPSCTPATPCGLSLEAAISATYQIGYALARMRRWFCASAYATMFGLGPLLVSVALARSSGASFDGMVRIVSVFSAFTWAPLAAGFLIAGLWKLAKAQSLKARLEQATGAPTASAWAGGLPPLVLGYSGPTPRTGRQNSLTRDDELAGRFARCLLYLGLAALGASPASVAFDFMTSEGLGIAMAFLSFLLAVLVLPVALAMGAVVDDDA